MQLYILCTLYHKEELNQCLDEMMHLMRVYKLKLNLDVMEVLWAGDSAELSSSIQPVLGGASWVPISFLDPLQGAFPH